MKTPNGWLADDLIIYHELDERGFAAKGFVIETPDFRHTGHGFLNHFQDVLRGFLRSLDPGIRAQVRWSVDSDYKDALLAYDAVTKTATNDWTLAVRRERFQRYWKKMENRHLRRERLHLFLARPCPAVPSRLSGRKLQEHHRLMVEQLAQGFEHHEQILRHLFGSVGCRIAAMSDEDHFRHFAHQLNPSFRQRLGFDPISLFNPNHSIQENCWRSGGEGAPGLGSSPAGYGFHLDGHYHNVIALRRRPAKTYPGILQALTNLPFLDYSLTVNLTPKDVRREIAAEEKKLERIRGDYAAESRHAMLTSIRKKETKIANLSMGSSSPFDYHFLVHLWDISPDGLAAKASAIKTAINAMGGADYWEANLATTAKNLWFLTWPGFLWSRYNAYADDGEDAWLADLLPFSSTFTGHLDEAEALYDGNNSNLVGVSTHQADTPQLGVVLGMTRAGKSAFMCDLLAQTEPNYDFTLILEEGLSYGLYTQTMGSQPIVVHPDGELTLNYLDTQGAPLSSLQITSAAALAARMAGECRDEDKRNLRLAQLTQYVDQLYTDVYEAWARTHETEVADIARTACAVSQFQRQQLPPGATFLEAWSEFHHDLEAGEEVVEELLHEVREEEVSRFLHDPATSKLTRNAAFARLTPEQMPTHSMLHELMLLAPFAEHDPTEIHHLTTLLAPWCEQHLVNGVSNVSLKEKIAHFELGYLPEAASELKAVVGFLIANHARQHIVTLPRSVRKRVVFEEVSRTLDMPGGEKLVSEFYAQLSKFNTWIISIVQQYQRFKASKIRGTVMGNAKQLFLLRQNDRADLEDIGRDIELPEATRDAIMRYPLPEHLPKERRFASLSYYHLDAQQPLCGTIENHCSPAGLYVSNSSPSDFDRRARQLKQHSNLVDGILREADQPTQSNTPNNP